MLGTSMYETAYYVEHLAHGGTWMLYMGNEEEPLFLFPCPHGSDHMWLFLGSTCLSKNQPIFSYTLEWLKPNINIAHLRYVKSSLWRERLVLGMGIPILKSLGHFAALRSGPVKFGSLCWVAAQRSVRQGLSSGPASSVLTHFHGCCHMLAAI